MRTTTQLVLSGLLLSAVVAGCAGGTPDPADFGYRRDAGGALVIVYPPRCPEPDRPAPGDVFGASVLAEGDNGEEILWSARQPRSQAVRQGEFVVGGDTSFAGEEQPLKGELPEGFHVSVVEAGPGGTEVTGADGYVDLSRLDGATLGPDEYMTRTGKTLTRAEITSQKTCG
ncbi:hypothetical protein ACFXAZ_15260 [Streptomyces sp. NPDC059477]|uniref:hypothetical protein n=1 Tax=Streptomyces sp. NPDC059477 TaxID=3346847 RepID=UPI003679A428